METPQESWFLRLFTFLISLTSSVLTLLTAWRASAGPASLVNLKEPNPPLPSLGSMEILGSPGGISLPSSLAFLGSCTPAMLTKRTSHSRHCSNCFQTVESMAPGAQKSQADVSPPYRPIWRSAGESFLWGLSVSPVKRKVCVGRGAGAR